MGIPRFSFNIGKTCGISNHYILMANKLMILDFGPKYLFLCSIIRTSKLIENIHTNFKHSKALNWVLQKDSCFENAMSGGAKQKNGVYLI